MRQLSFVQREFIRPELAKDFQSLCTEEIAMTDNLFGDDLNKRMKEAELASKVASKNYGGMLWPTYILDVAG